MKISQALFAVSVAVLASGSGYNSTQGLVLTCCSANSYVTAIRFGLDTSACQE